MSELVLVYDGRYDRLLKVRKDQPRSQGLFPGLGAALGARLMKEHKFELCRKMTRKHEMIITAIRTTVYNSYTHLCG